MAGANLTGEPSVTRRMDIPKTFEKMAGSSVFLVLGEIMGLQSLRGKGAVYQQILMAKSLKKPTILTLDKNLSPSEQEEFGN